MEILVLLIPLSVVLALADRRGLLVVGEERTVRRSRRARASDPRRRRHRATSIPHGRTRRSRRPHGGLTSVNPTSRAAGSIPPCLVGDAGPHDRQARGNRGASRSRSRWRYAREVATGSHGAETMNARHVRRRSTTRWCASSPIMTVVWGIVGMLVGVIIAAQLLWPELNFDIPWLSYGRLRPLHTNAVIFAFGGSALFATSYYVVQRTCQVRLFSRRARGVHVLGLAGGHRARRGDAAAGLHRRQGIRRARMADRHPDHAGVGRLRRRVLRHDRASARRRTSTSPTGSSARSS